MSNSFKNLIRSIVVFVLCLGSCLLYISTDVTKSVIIHQELTYVTRSILNKSSTTTAENNTILYSFSTTEYFNRTRQKTNSVIVFLVPSFAGTLHLGFNPYPRLCQRVLELDSNINDNCTADVIIFHTGYPYREDIQPIIENSRRQVEFINIDHIFYRFSPGFRPHLYDPNWTMKGKWNYHHMCYFWFKQVFKFEILRRYRYMMRLDDDSQILGHWPNIFQIMETSRAIYLANRRELDYEYVLRGLSLIRNLTAAYIAKKNLSPKNPKLYKDFFNHTWNIPNYWNNFEVLELNFMQRQDVQDYIREIDRSQGIFRYRWGDAPLRYVMLALFTRESDVLHREKLGLQYCHGVSC